MDKRFIFRGNAVGVAGHLNKPEDMIIWVQGASALPTIGGYSRSSVDGMRFSDILSIEGVRTQTTGDYSEKEKAYKTLANAVVKGLNVHGRLTADALEATFTSTHPVDGGEPQIIPAGTSITNLRLDGYPVAVELDIDLFTRYSTRSALCKAYESDDAFYKRYGNRFQSSDKARPNQSKKREMPEPGGYIVCSIASEIRTDHPKAQIAGNVITLDGFGRIYLGELLITGTSRRLSLLRLKLGSPIGGDVECSEVESNGSLIF